MKEIEPSTPRTDQAISTEEPLPEVPTPSGILESADAIMNQMDDLLKEVGGDKPAEAPAAPTPAAPVPAAAVSSIVKPSIESLDEQLAKLTEEIIESESAFRPQTPPQPTQGRPTSAQPKPQTPPAPAPGHSDEQDEEDDPAPVAASAPDAPAQASTNPPAPAPAQANASPAPAAIAPQPSQPAAPSVLSRIGSGLSAAMLPAFGLFAKPLASKPKVVRDSIGWIALNTLFIGACLWLYLLFIRQPASDHSRGFDINSSELPQPAAPAAATPKPAKSDDHAPAAKKGTKPKTQPKASGGH